MEIAAMQVWFRTELSSIYDLGEAAAITRELLFQLTGAKPPYHQEVNVDDTTLQTAKSYLAKLIIGEPLQYVLGKAWFRDMELVVSPAVLIPRPETAELIDLALHEIDFKPENILDICTGSGCIALALKKSFPTSQVLACDVSLEALQIAKENSSMLELDVSFFWTDVLSGEFLEETISPLDVIISNPPYISSNEKGAMHQNVLKHEPHLALFAPSDDPIVFYRRIALYAVKNLRSGGVLLLEANPIFIDETAAILKMVGLNDVRIYEDLSGKDRFLFARG